MKQLHTKHNGNQRVKYKLIGEMKTRCVWKQDKTNGYLKNGAAVARKPVTSIAERRPNKESSQLRRKS